jgi:hypothetical protein
MRLVKGYEDRHNFTNHQGTHPLPLFCTTGQQLFRPNRKERLAKIIGITE